MVTFLETQITETKSLITKVNAAISATLLGGHSSYEIDTGQSNQGVKRLSIEQLRKLRKDLLGELSEMEVANGDKRNAVTMKADF